MMAKRVCSIDELMEVFTKVGLEKECERRKISRDGDKAELAKRIVEHDFTTKKDGGDRDESDYEDCEEPAMTTRKKKVVKEVDEFHGDGRAVSIRDVEDSIEKFGAEDGQDVVTWIADFEEMCDNIGWGDLQKLIAGKKALSGTAKKFVLAQSGITTWSSLRRALIKEFSPRWSSADVHRKLQSRQKDPNERSLDYVYEMQRIAKAGGVDEMTVCEYICDGIPGDVSRKAILYEAKSIEDLKVKLETYDKLVLKKKNSMTKENVKDEVKSSAKESEGTIKSSSQCFNCGGDGHKSMECPDKDKGPKCFKCNGFDHIARDCKKKSEKVASVNVIQSDDRKLKNIPTILMKINASEVKGAVDTCSEVSLMKESLWEQIKTPDMEAKPTQMKLCGFNGAYERARIEVMLKVVIDAEKYEFLCYIVRNEAMDLDMIVGRNFLDGVNYSITSQGVSVKPREPESVTKPKSMLEETELANVEIGEFQVSAQMKEDNSVMACELDEEIVLSECGVQPHESDEVGTKEGAVLEEPQCNDDQGLVDQQRVYSGGTSEADECQEWPCGNGKFPVLDRGREGGRKTEGEGQDERSDV
uniref:CCHC-type domain-containing protein n=1 Tax=Lutzomyia longipalpis TaxID=7200 RepID=A0A1B0CKJ5_LUTLO